jgi:hypothetical protein
MSDLPEDLVEALPEAPAGMEVMAMAVKSGPTEMGFRVDLHSKTVNVMVEVDLEGDPEWMMVVLKMLPEIFEQQLLKAVVKPEEE